jgi:pentalenene oxygenase
MKSVNLFPEAAGGLPVIGHALPLLRTPLEFLRGLPAHGDLVQIRLGRRRILIVCDPELTHTVLVQDRIFDKGGPLFERAREIIGNGIVTSPSTEHRRQRRLFQPAFHHTRLPAYAQIMSDRIAAVADGWRDGQVLNITKEMQKITSRIMLSAMFNTSLSDAKFAEFEEDVDILTSGVYLRMVLPDIFGKLPTFGNRRYLLAHKRVRRTPAEAVAQRSTADAEAGDDLMSRLLSARDAEGDGQGMSGTELIDQAVTIFAAGIETVATTLAWALHLVSRHPEVATSLYEEAHTALAGTTATWDDLPLLTYTRNVITEALRMYPPAWLFTRTTNSDTRLGNHLVPAGTTLAYSAYIIGHLSSLYEDPEDFNPDRWSADAPHTPPRHAFVAFGGGARKCIGDEFGMIEAVLVLASIMKRWRVHPQPGDGHHPEVRVILRPKALKLKVTTQP